MVARTKMSPSLLIDESTDRRNRSDRAKGNLHRNDSSLLSEYSSMLSHSESFDGSFSSSSPNNGRPVAPSPCGARVRSRFLCRLGIAPPPQTVAMDAKPKGSHKRCRSRDSQNEKSFEVPLKDKSHEEEESRSSFPFGSLIHRHSDCSATSSSTSSCERNVSFCPVVTVHPIPKHTAYSARIRETIWTNPTEMQESAARNCIEFAAENWDWRQVAEDQDMVYYHGELVHPVHFAHEYNIRRQFCAVMSAQQQQQHCH